MLYVFNMYIQSALKLLMEQLESYTVYTINDRFAVYYLIKLVILNSDVNSEKPRAH